MGCGIAADEPLALHNRRGDWTLFGLDLASGRVPAALKTLDLAAQLEFTAR
jgi:hypothetical protein